MIKPHPGDVLFVQVDTGVRPVSVTSPMPSDAAIEQADAWLQAAIAALPEHPAEVPGLAVAEVGRQAYRRRHLEQQRRGLRDGAAACRAEDQRLADLREKLAAVESLIEFFERKRNACAELARHGDFQEAREAGRALRTCDDCLAVLTGRTAGGFLPGSRAIPTRLYDVLAERGMVVRGTEALIETPTQIAHRIATVDARKSAAAQIVADVVAQIEQERRG
jgi:hypothetical protein